LTNDRLSDEFLADIDAGADETNTDPPESPVDENVMSVSIPVENDGTLKDVDANAICAPNDVAEKAAETSFNKKEVIEIGCAFYRSVESRGGPVECMRLQKELVSSVYWSGNLLIDFFFSCRIGICFLGFFCAILAIRGQSEIDWRHFYFLLA